MEAGLVQAEGAARARWERFTRGSEVGVRGIGRSVEQAFEMAAVALCSVVADPLRVEVREEIEFEVEARTTDGLLADWLSAVVRCMASRHLRFRCFAVRIDGPRLFGHGFGEHADLERHLPGLEVTGATLTQVSVHQGPDGLWAAECLVDV